MRSNVPPKDPPELLRMAVPYNASQALKDFISKIQQFAPTEPAVHISKMMKVVVKTTLKRPIRQKAFPRSPQIRADLRTGRSISELGKFWGTGVACQALAAAGSVLQMTLLAAAAASGAVDGRR
jgi:hypothetical protein